MIAISKSDMLDAELQAELKEVLESFGLTAGKILKRPIDGLVAHHKQHILQA